jgi:acyl-CoA reductase-like NAD-dependent aldehyde dehydrogenase
MDQFRNYINGEWVKSDATTPNVNPSDTNDVIGEYANASTAHVTDALASARAALSGWSNTSTQVRADILNKVAAELAARKDEIGELLSREEGKVRADGVGEVMRASHVFSFFAGEALRLGGENLPSVRPGVDIQISRNPVGVVGIITPWNFPIAIPAWKIAPALAFGNTVVIKPAELTPGCVWAIVDILARAGVPKGVINLVMGRGSAIGPVMVDGVDALTFTGSEITGKRIAEQAITRMTKLQLEMGGKNPLVVLDDADFDTALNCAVNGAFYQTGQRCTASSRIIVTNGIHDKFVKELSSRVAAIKVDHALKPGTEVGPVVDKRQLETDLHYLKVGEQEGAKRIGGELLNRETPGFYLSPALFTETTNAMRINREEIFGPVASVIRVKDYDEALNVANDAIYGLSAGIVTTSLKYASHFRSNVQSGLTMVNLPTAGLDYHVPFGGVKMSGYGPREQGRYAAEFYTTVKTSYTAA